jgi:6-pyruvoyltetrahydropterin/6-carboxytetrahydropterin synthase
MFKVRVETAFKAAHRLRLGDGTVEPSHTHDWLVRATFARDGLDKVGMVVDFQRAQGALQAIAGELHRTDLNSCKGFSGANPTAENVARHIFRRLNEEGWTDVSAVEITEAPGCVASFERPPGEGRASFDVAG